MKRHKLFFISFIIVFISTSVLCIIFEQPLIYAPVKYSVENLLHLALLLGFLVFSLVYISYPILHWLKKRLRFRVNKFSFYLTTTLIILQLVTMTMGYLESYSRRGIDADFLYYYKCVTNSCIYIFTGNLTAIVATILYAKTLSPKD